MARRLDLRLPAGAVVAGPEVHRFFVVDDVAVFFVDGEDTVDAVGDVAEVTEKRALDAFGDVGIGPTAAADAGEKVGNVVAHVATAGALTDFLVLHIERLVAAAVEAHRAFVAEEANAKAVAVDAVWRPAQSF